MNEKRFSEEMETYYTHENSATPFQGRRQLRNEKKNLKKVEKHTFFYVLSDELTYQKEKMGMSQDSLLCSVTSDEKQVPVR